ncbi:MAG: hypothetical protein JEZ06_17360 [Anaerolineaceae bacterium]|nr:hypothetical protein [Anaerolineaceae bacterium]
MLSIPNLPNTVIIQHSICVPLSVESVFRFFIENNLSAVYSEIAEGHEYFTLRTGTELEVGSIIDCKESAANQTIVHEYHVTKISANERIAYSSKPSQCKINFPWAVVESKSNTYVYYDLDRNNESETLIRLTIGIQFDNRTAVFMTSLFGGLTPWKKHCREEMEGLKTVIADLA